MLKNFQFSIKTIASIPSNDYLQEISLYNQTVRDIAKTTTDLNQLV